MNQQSPEDPIVFQEEILLYFKRRQIKKRNKTKRRAYFDYTGITFQFYVQSSDDDIQPRRVARDEREEIDEF